MHRGRRLVDNVPPWPDDSFVQVENLHRHYGGTHALKGVSFQVERGEVLGLLGPNGAGKTTTMQLLAGALAPSAGDIRIGGKSIITHPKACKAELGYLPENPPLYPELTVDEYLRYCARLRRVPSHRNAEAIDVAKSRCGLSESGPRLIGNLSKGFKQRVGIAQAIVHSPALVILDEPTVGLDPNQIREIRRLIAELRGEHSIILSTHILPEAQAVCDRVQIINEGKLVLTQSLNDITGERQRHLKVGFSNPPDESILAALPTVDGVEPIETGFFRLRYHSREELTQALLAAALEGEWGLLEITPQHDTLEELFVRLTTGESPTEC